MSSKQKVESQVERFPRPHRLSWSWSRSNCDSKLASAELELKCGTSHGSLRAVHEIGQDGELLAP